MQPVNEISNPYILQEKIERAFEFERQQIDYERFYEHNPISTGNQNLQESLGGKKDGNAKIAESKSPPIQEEHDQDDDG